ncbi:hypothetical protein J2785_004870 [Burkholderia ambifaria]|nr:hypothetical protein [Burkholderia ambifaria]
MQHSHIDTSCRDVVSEMDEHRKCSAAKRFDNVNDLLSSHLRVCLFDRMLFVRP